MDESVTTYFAAWNEPDAGRRRLLLERCVTDDAELIDPTGRWQGIDGLVERIGRYQTAAPGTEIVPASGQDVHNDVIRYAWTIVDGDGRNIIDGLDVAERTTGGRLRRILMFHGPLPSTDEPPAAARVGMDPASARADHGAPIVRQPGVSGGGRGRGGRLRRGSKGARRGGPR